MYYIMPFECCGYSLSATDRAASALMGSPLITNLRFLDYQDHPRQACAPTKGADISAGPASFVTRANHPEATTNNRLLDLRSALRLPRQNGVLYPGQRDHEKRCE